MPEKNLTETDSPTTVIKDDSILVEVIQPGCSPNDLLALIAELTLDKKKLVQQILDIMRYQEDLAQMQREGSTVKSGDIGIAYVSGDEDEELGCVINNKILSAVAKERVEEFEQVVVVPGGTDTRPFVVPFAVDAQIKRNYAVRDRKFNIVLPAANENILTPSLSPVISPSYLYVYVMMDTLGVLTLNRTYYKDNPNDAVTISEPLNNGEDLYANTPHVFIVPWRENDSINFTYSVGVTASASPKALIFDLIEVSGVSDLQALPSLIYTKERWEEQTLEVKLLDAVTTTGASAAQNVFIYKDLTVCIVASGVLYGGYFIFEGSPDGVNWGSVGSVRDRGEVDIRQDVVTDGTYFFEIVNASTLKYFRINLASLIGIGTFTAYLFARA